MNNIVPHGAYQITMKECKMLYKFNVKQLVVSAITGWDPIETGAKDNFYYDKCKTIEDKLEQIQEYSENFFNNELTISDIYKIYEFIEKEHVNNNEKINEFWDL